MRPGTYILMGMGIVVAILFGFLVGRRCPRNDPGEPPTPRADTLFIRDTITLERPILVKSYVYDTIRTYFTTVRHDTVMVDVPMERKVYQEDSVYRAVVSGWRPTLDSLTIYPKETIITITRPEVTPVRKRWGLGVQAGMGACKDGLTPYVGVGVSYNLLSW